MRVPPPSPRQMASAGWQRVDPRPWRKTTARWHHASGWRLAHCGHPTALWPWALFAPDGKMHLTGGRRGNPEFGRAWPDLREAVTYVAGQLAKAEAA